MEDFLCGISGCIKKDLIEFSANVFTKEIDNNVYNVLLFGRVHDLSHSCEEELLDLYLKYNEDFLSKIDGAFSLAIYNKTKNKLLIARDRLGLRPVYYTHIKDNFAFSTDVKNIFNYGVITPKVGKDELCEMFGLGPGHSPNKTFFKDVYALEAGHYAIFENNELTLVKYWDLTSKESTDTIDDAIAKVRELLVSSTKQEINDEKICSMLSGGLDSSVLSYIASKETENLNTFSISYDNNDEHFKSSDYQPTKDSDYIKVVSDFLNTKHTNFSFSHIDLFNNLRNSMIARGFPGMADVDSSLFVFLKEIAKSGYKVILSGECSDEIFGGYPWYYKANLKDSETFPWSILTDARASIINKNLVSSEELKKYLKGAYDTTISNVVYLSSDPEENNYRKLCYLTIKWFMNTLVERSERLSVTTGVDVRTPFANYELFEYVYNLSAKYKFGLINENTVPIEKYILRKAFEGTLPHEIIYRKKSPFPKTYDPKYLELLENEIGKIITSSTSPLLELINVKYLFEIINTKGKCLNGNWYGQLMTYPQLLAYLIQINMWLEEFNPIIEI